VIRWRAVATVAFAITAGFALGSSVTVQLMTAANPPIVVPDHSVTSVSLIAEALDTPCAQEDSDNCYWDAEEQGNGEGTSFVAIDGNVYYGEESN
jgi:hypothetical protein